MASLEWGQVLPTAPEVSFEITITLACSWLIVLYLYLYAINRYRGYCCIIVPVLFPRYCLCGYEATKLIIRVYDVAVAYIYTSHEKFYHAFSALFVLQATIAVVKDWEQG